MNIWTIWNAQLFHICQINSSNPIYMQYERIVLAWCNEQNFLFEKIAKCTVTPLYFISARTFRNSILFIFNQATMQLIIQIVKYSLKKYVYVNRKSRVIGFYCPLRQARTRFNPHTNSYSAICGKIFRKNHHLHLKKFL